MFTTRPWWVVKKTPSGLRGEFQRVPLILLICFPHSSFCNIHYALKTAGKQEHGLLWGSKERGLREAGRENERKTQHIYSTGLNGALQFEHNTRTVAGRRTGGKWWWRWCGGGGGGGSQSCTEMSVVLRELWWGSNTSQQAGDCRGLDSRHQDICTGRRLWDKQITLYF